jgi:nonribosomal peptide synthetase MxcG
LAVPDDEVGSRLVAHVVGGTALTEEGIKRHCLARLPKYMIPEAFIFQEALPRTSTGKIDRQALTRG